MKSVLTYSKDLILFKEREREEGQLISKLIMRKLWASIIK